MLASGGLGHLYAVTTNPTEARGHGLAIAARAGAVIADPEFVQFHPTAIDIGRDPAPLATEAIRGEGAMLVNKAGERFMLQIHPEAELAPRDIVARGVFAELQAGRGAFLDARKAIGASFAQRFPGVTAYCRSAGIDPARDLIPVAPAAHYHMGGVATDANGRTSLDGLWAAGEVASTGAHGANRLASNSLLEAVVYAARIAEDIGRLPTLPKTVRAGRPCRAARRQSRRPIRRASRRLRQLMSPHVGVIRDRDGPEPRARARSPASSASAARMPQLRNMATAALLVTAAALRREESRGGHYRSDYPEHRSRSRRQRTFLTLDDARAIAAARRACTSGPWHDRPALPRRVPLAARDRRRGDARARRGSRPRRRRHLDRDRAGGNARRAPSWSRARPARSPACRWSRRRCASSIRQISITAHHRDGDAVAAKTTLLTIEGDARAVLAAERVALNFLGHLSGIATADRRVRQADRAHQGARLLHAENHAGAARAARNTRCAAAAGSITASGSTTRS